MATPVIMPRQGQSVESCIITKWHKQKGDKVAVGDVLFSYETDKSAFDEEAKVEGTLIDVFFKEGDDVECLLNVCVIGNEGEDTSSFNPGAAAPAPAEETKPEVKAEAPVVAAVAPVTVSQEKSDILKASPRAKNLAAKKGLDISLASPTGPNGRIIERDVFALEASGVTAVAEISAEPAPVVAAPAGEYEDVKLPNIRKVISKQMTKSLTEGAQLTLNTSFDATDILAFRAKLKKSGEALGMGNITLNDIVLYAVAKTILNHKDLNANLFGETIRYFNTVNLGVAVDTPRGLMVPVIKGAEKLSLAEISAQAKALANDAKSGSINPDLLNGGSFSVSNLGSLGVESFTPVINPPQTGILGVDNMQTKVKLVDGQPVYYQSMGLSLTFDHRAIDGAPAARFLKDLCTALENFSLLLAK